MKLKQLDQNAIAFFESGYNCAEAVSLAIIEAFSDATPEEILRVASVFGAGVAGTGEEACGALTGGLIAIGYLMGHSTPEEPNSLADENARLFREKFSQLNGATKCAVLLDQFGEQQNYNECRRLVGKAAYELARVLKNAGLKMVD